MYVRFSRDLPQVLSLDDARRLGVARLTSAMLNVGTNTTVKLVIATGERISIHNEGTEDVNFSAGKMLAGYMEGKWWKANNKRKHGEGNPGNTMTDADVKFQLHDANDQVILGTDYVCLGDLITQ